MHESMGGCGRDEEEQELQGDFGVFCQKGEGSIFYS